MVEAIVKPIILFNEQKAILDFTYEKKTQKHGQMSYMLKPCKYNTYLEVWRTYWQQHATLLKTQCNIQPQLTAKIRLKCLGTAIENNKRVVHHY